MPDRDRTLYEIVSALKVAEDFLRDLRWARTRDEVWLLVITDRLGLADEALLAAIESLRAIKEYWPAPVVPPREPVNPPEWDGT